MSACVSQKHYCVVYLSEGRMHYRFRCYAVSSRQAKKYCRECMGVDNEHIVEVYQEF